MKQDRIMSFQMSKKLDQIDLDKVSGGVDENMSLNPTYCYDYSGLRTTLDQGVLIF